nr:hypothetical protein [Tanacetum cinerariifolium]
GVTAALAARDANRNGDDSHTSGTGRPVQVTHECTYLDFLKCQPLNFKGTEGFVRLRSLGHYKSECPIVKIHEHVDMIHGRMRASKPKTMQDAMEIATKLRNKKISTLVECETENKKRLDNTSKNNQNQQQPNKRQNTGRAYTARHGEKKHYSGSKPLCSKCNYHHDGPCAPKCHQCNKFGHLTRDCRNSINANTTNIQKGTGARVLQMPILLTSKKALEQVRRLHATNVGIKGTIGEIVRIERTKTKKTKSKVLRHAEWCMPLEEEKPNKTLTTLRMRLKLKRESCLA